MGSFMRRLGFSALTLMISAGAVTTAAADVTKTVAAANQPSGIVSFIFGGTVGESTLMGVRPGDKFSGTFTYDSTLSNGGVPGTFDFSQLPVAHTVSLGAGTFHDSSVSSVSPTSPLDQYTIQTTNNRIGQPSSFVLTASTLNKPQPDALTLTFVDPTGSSFSTDRLPTTLNLALFQNATVSYDPPAGSFSGMITSLQQLQAVPEPAAVVLLGVGAACLLGYRRYFRSQAPRPSVA